MSNQETPATPFQSYSCVRRGIDGLIAAVDFVIDRAYAEPEDLKGYRDPAEDVRFA